MWKLLYGLNALFFPVARACPLGIDWDPLLPTWIKYFYEYMMEVLLIRLTYNLKPRLITHRVKSTSDNGCNNVRIQPTSLIFAHHPMTLANGFRNLFQFLIYSIESHN